MADTSRAVALVPDGETGALMVALHERLRAGVAPADALAQLQAGQPAGRRVFVCFGAGCLGQAHPALAALRPSAAGHALRPPVTLAGA